MYRNTHRAVTPPIASRRMLGLVLLALAAGACRDDRVETEVTSPFFSLASATSVSSDLSRSLKFVDASGVTSVSVADTSGFHAPFDGYFADADTAVGAAGPISVKSHSAFEAGENGQWSATDANGVTHTVRLIADGGPWETLEVYSDGRLVGAFDWSWRSVDGGWLMSKAEASFPLDDGALAVYSTARKRTLSLGALDPPVRLADLVAGAGHQAALNVAGWALPRPLSASTVRECEAEIVAAAVATAFAALMWTRARQSPTPSNIRAAWVATATAAEATRHAVECLLNARRLES